jgi:hypothetical protein
MVTSGERQVTTAGHSSRAMLLQGSVCDELNHREFVE